MYKQKNAGTAAAGTCAVTATGGTVTAAVLTIANAVVTPGMVMSGRATGTGTIAPTAISGGALQTIATATGSVAATFQWQLLSGSSWANIPNTNTIFNFASTTAAAILTGTRYVNETVGKTFSLRCICTVAVNVFTSTY